MTAEVVNLRQARKARRRVEAAAEAQANRLQHGRTKMQRARDAIEQARSARVLDGARREE